jgi:sterol desaturase/sphingolipid hydroxylase (fatty acid hydroxylase superfamily)
MDIHFIHVLEGAIVGVFAVVVFFVALDLWDWWKHR